MWRLQGGCCYFTGLSLYLPEALFLGGTLTAWRQQLAANDRLTSPALYRIDDNEVWRPGNIVLGCWAFHEILRGDDRQQLLDLLCRQWVEHKRAPYRDADVVATMVPSV